MFMESVMSSNHLILCRPLLLLPSIFPSVRVFSNASACLIRWPKFWSYSISPSNEYSGLISLRVNWFHLLAVQESSPAPQFESINFQHSVFFTIQLSHLYMATGNAWLDSLDRPLLATWCLCFLICCHIKEVGHSFSSKEQASFNLKAVVTVHSDFGAQENNVCHCFPFFLHLPWSDETGCHNLCFLNVEF